MATFLSAQQEGLLRTTCLLMMATLSNLIYMEVFFPGLKICLFSVTSFASRGHYAIVKKNEIQLMFGQDERPLTLMLKNGMPVANNATVKQFTIVTEDVKQQSQKKRLIWRLPMPDLLGQAEPFWQHPVLKFGMTYLSE
jgi:hypothetical protein